MTPAEILTKARQIHKERGYYKGALSAARLMDIPEETAPVCMLGALQLATTGCIWEFNAQTHFARLRVLDPLLKSEGFDRDVSAFNDDPNTTPEDIDLMWKKAIYKAEELEGA